MANDDIKNKDQDVHDGFDFSDMEWDKSGDDTTAASPKSAPLGDDDPFNSATDDDAFGGNDSFYSLEQMPDADGGSTDFGDVGGDDDAFGDIKTDSESTGYDFGSTDDDLPVSKAITDDASSFDDEAENDPFADTAATYSNDDDGVSDPFASADDQPAEYEEIVAANENERPAGSSKLKFYLMTAAAVVVGAFGIVYVAPSFLGGDQTPQVAQVDPITPAPAQFPSTLPQNNTAGEEVAMVAPPMTPAVDTAPNPVLPVTTPETPVLSIPPLAAPATAPAATLPSVKPSVEAPVMAPVDTVIDDPLKDMVGGSGRGGIDALKDKAPVVAPVAAPAEQSEDLASILSRLGSLESKVEKLADSFDNYVQLQPAAAAPAKPAVTRSDARPVVQSGEIIPPMKPPIIEGASLKGIAGDLAWISTGSGVVEVRIGDTVPKGGKVVAFKNYRGSWIVVTTDGLIVRQ